MLRLRSLPVLLHTPILTPHPYCPRPKLTLTFPTPKFCILVLVSGRPYGTCARTSGSG